jgi:hypothetical protein
MNYCNVGEGKVKKVKLSLYRPWRPLGLREVEAPVFSDFQPTDDGKVIRPYAPAAFYPQGNSAAGRIR